MSNENNSLESGRRESSNQQAGPQTPRSTSRRALLKGSVATLPAILTLQSGAALARSSNLISGTDSSATDSRGRTLCLDVDSVYPAGDLPDVYDLGDPAYARVSAINDRDYRRRPRNQADRVSESRMCNEGGTFYFKDGRRWQERSVPRGMLVSATALSSFSGDIVITDL